MSLQMCRGCVLLWIVLCAGLTLSACQTPPRAPIDQRPPPPSEKINHHIVSQGETLFAIAWRYEKDLDKLARANGLSRPYTIYNGQRLTLNTSYLPAVRRTVTPAARQPVISRPNKPPEQPPIQVTKPPPKSTASLPSNWHWQWPSEGRVTKTYNSDQLFKGVDIESHSGQPVVAAAPGVVVYAGDGLRGYGQLIIVKHSEVYLSAYAHCRKIFVREGQMLKGGEKIAEVGGDPANTKRLYFEIRKDGKPVNPLSFLPRR